MNSLIINILAIFNLRDVKDVGSIVNLIYDSVCADSDTIEIVKSFQLLDTARTRFRRETIEMRGDPFLESEWEFSPVSRCGRGEPNFEHDGKPLPFQTSTLATRRLAPSAVFVPQVHRENPAKAHPTV